MGRICNAFAESANFQSILSISHVNQSPSTIGKTVWFLVFAATLIGSIYKIYEFGTAFFKYPVVLGLYASRERNLTFPAVTFCNLNRMKTYLQVRSESDAPEGTPLLFSERRSLQYCKKLENGTVKLDGKNTFATEFLINFYGMNETERFKLGIHPRDFLIKCSFNGKQCTENQLSYFVNFRFGNCVTFNKRTPTFVPFRVSETGINSGLALTLDLTTAYYQSTVHTFGAKVVIHDPNEIPNPQEDGFFISPGHETAISLKQTLYRRLPDPYKDRCKDYEAETDQSIRNKNDCIRSCIQKKCYEYCGCIDPSLGIASKLRPCNLTNAIESCCLNEVLDAMARFRSPCDCPLPCSALYYKEQISRSLLVSREKKLRVSNTFFLRNDKVMLKVFYSSMEKNIYEQNPKWKEAELLSQIGNEIGLWLGISVAVLFELVEKLILFIKNVYLLCR